MKKRKVLTNQEWNAIQHLTRKTHLDNSFDVWQKKNGDSCFIDMENGNLVSLTVGFGWLCDGMAYPLAHEGLSEEEANIIVNLLREFEATTDEQFLSWLLESDEKE